MSPEFTLSTTHQRSKRPRIPLRSIVLILLLCAGWRMQYASSQVEIVQIGDKYCTDSSGIIEIGQVFYNEQSFRKQKEALEVLYASGQLNEQQYLRQIEAMREERFQIFIKGVVLGILAKSGFDLIRFFAK